MHPRFVHRPRPFHSMDLLRALRFATALCALLLPAAGCDVGASLLVPRTDGGMTCPTGRIACGGTCVDTAVNPIHCGACGRMCGASEMCVTGVCMPLVGSSAGCADGTREAFTSVTTFPTIAGCAGGFSEPGLFPPPARVGGTACADSGNSSLSNATGTTCSATDLCSVGWHLCRGGEVPRATGGTACAATTFPAGSFFAASMAGPGCDHCASLTNTRTGCTNSACLSDCRETSDLTNGLFGCGAGRASVSCELAATAGDLCADVPGGGWVCPFATSEAADVTKTTPNGGGVLCCRD